MTHDESSQRRHGRAFGAANHERNASGGAKSAHLEDTGRIPERADVVIIGGGIIGLCTALHLARQRRVVIVIERNRIMREASGVNAGSLGVQNKLLSLVPYAIEALALWRAMKDELRCDVGFRNAGGWRVAMNPAEKHMLRQSAEAQAKHGVEITWHEKDDLRQKACFLGDDVLAASHSWIDSYANPLLFGAALRDAVEHAGVRIFENCEVSGIASDKNWSIETSAGNVKTECALIAAGAWSGRLLSMIGIDVPIGLDVNMMTVTEPSARFMDGIVFHVRGILTVKQTTNGSCLIGGGWQGRGELETGRKDLDYETSLHNIRLAANVLPGLKPLNILRQWSGFEGVTPDSMPYFSALADRSGLFVCSCVRGGWTLGPLFGRLAAELIATGSTSLPISLFSPLRHSKACVDG